MATVRDNLIAARAIYDANSHQWSFHQSIDYAADAVEDEDPEEAYAGMMAALRLALPQVPRPESSIVRWSKRVGAPEIFALFDRAISAQEPQP